MRDPRLACRQLGPRAFLTFQILFGGMIAASLMHVMFAGHLLAAAYAYLANGEVYLSAGVLAAVDAFNIALAYAVFILTARLVASPSERPLLRRLWSLWFYWLIVSLAGLRAIGQLFHARTCGRRPRTANRPQGPEPPRPGRRDGSGARRLAVDHVGMGPVVPARDSSCQTPLPS